MNKTISDSLRALFFYFTSLLLGWLIAGFVFIYSTLRDDTINQALAYYMQISPVWIGLGFFLSGIYWLLARIPSARLLTPSVNRLVGWQTLVIVLMLINYIAYRLSWHLHVFELISFFLAISLTLRWGLVLSAQLLPGWQHPTTFGTFINATLLNGCALWMLLLPYDNSGSVIPYLFIIFLLLEMLILFARFRYLSGHNQVTNSLARLLMSRYLFLFGSRIIVGIFMPLVFIVYYFFRSGETLEGVAILILVGTLLERYLFIKTSGEPA